MVKEQPITALLLLGNSVFRELSTSQAKKVSNFKQLAELPISCRPLFMLLTLIYLGAYKIY
jgi:hypothetical protein